RAGHALGNNLFNRVYQALFGHDFTDIFSGYRVFTRRFAKSFPALSAGFEIETEMSVHASSLRLPVVEIETEYGKRVEGSASKLSTIRDGLRILTMMAMLLKETKPFVFFGLIATALFAAAGALLLPVLADYLATGMVPRFPTFILSMTLLIGAMLSASCGVILDSVSRMRVEQKRIFYLSQAPARGERALFGTDPAEERSAEAPTSPRELRA
ncbi:MAG: glycosyl transferase, partial [Hyphomonas sp.]